MAKPLAVEAQGAFFQGSIPHLRIKAEVVVPVVMIDRHQIAA